MKRSPRLPLTVSAAVLGLVISAGVQSSADAPATHNMLVIGEETVYLSHLPMFQEPGQGPMPHRYQAILEVTFAGQESYAKDRRAHPSTSIYALNPERFVLPDLASSDKPLTSFNANTIFRGHLERDNRVPILENVKVKVNRVIHFRQFDPNAQRPASLEYLLFGKGKELFLAHRIAAPPDFDQVVSVTIAGNPFTDDELARGIPVAFPGKKDTVAERIQAKQQVQGEARLASSSTPRKIDVRVDRELYFEEGELRVPPTFRTTPEEKGAGFP